MYRNINLTCSACFDTLISWVLFQYHQYENINFGIDEKRVRLRVLWFQWQGQSRAIYQKSI